MDESKSRWVEKLRLFFVSVTKRSDQAADTRTGSKFFKDNWPLFVGALIAGFPLLILIVFAQLRHGIIDQGDMSFPLTIGNYLDRYFPMWNPYSQASNVQTIDRLWANVIPTWLGRDLGMSINLSYALYFFALIEIGYFSEYFFIKSVVSRVSGVRWIDSVAIASAIYFVYSPWAEDWYQGYDFFVAYVMLPLFLLSCLKYLKSGRVRFLLLAIVSADASASTPHFIIADSLFFLALILVIISKKKAGFPRTSIILRRSSVMAAVAVITNLYWLVPSLLLSKTGFLNPGVTVDSETVRTLTAHEIWYRIIVGYDQWTNWYQPGIGNKWYVVLLSVVPLFALWFTVSQWKGKSNSVLWTMIRWTSFIGIFIVASSNLPFLDTYYLFAAQRFSFGWLLRTPIAFTSIWWVTVPVAVTLGIGSLSIRFQRKGQTRSYFSLPIALIALLSISFVLTGGIEGVVLWTNYYAPNPIPRNYINAYKKLASYKSQDNGLLLDMAPYDFGIGKNLLRLDDSYTWSPGKILGYALPASAPLANISYFQQTTSLQLFAAYANQFALEGNPALLPLLREAGVSYVLFHNDIVGASLQGLKELKTLNSQLIRVATFGNTVFIFRVPQNLPMVSLANGRPKLAAANLNWLSSANRVLNRVVFSSQKRLTSHQLNALGLAACPQDGNIDQMLMAKGCGNQVLFPALRDSHSFASHAWNAWHSANFYEGAYPWANVISGVGISNAGYFGFGGGFVGISSAASGQATINAGTLRMHSGRYAVFVRFISSPKGGNVVFKIGDTISTIDTRSSSTSACWYELPHLFSGPRNSTVQIRNLNGADFINAIVAAPQKSPNLSSIAKRLSSSPCESNGSIAARHSGITIHKVSSHFQTIATSAKALASRGETFSLTPRATPTTLQIQEPCGSGWVVTVNGKDVPELCLDGFWTGAVLGAHSSPINIQIFFLPSKYWNLWTFITLTGTALLSLGGATYYVFRKSSA